MECIYKLPRELQLNILEFYYRKKSDDFCEDVKSFIITRNVLIADYQAYFKVYLYDHQQISNLLYLNHRHKSGYFHYS